MIWIYITLGSITLAAALLGLAASWTVRRPLAAWHGLAIFLLGVAWIIEHTAMSGRLCLVAAFAIEAIAWWALRGSRRATPPSSPAARSSPPGDHPSPSPEIITPPPAAPQPDPPGVAEMSAPDEACDQAQTSPSTEPPPDAVTPAAPPAEPATPEKGADTPNLDAEDSAVIDPPAEPPPDHEPELRTTTCILLKSPCAVAPGAFLASLRRCGRRDAALAPPPSGDVADAHDDGPCMIVSGDIVLSCASAAVPLDRVRIAEALARRDDATATTEAVVDHLAHIAVTTTHPIGTSRDEIVRLHHYAHAALTEFAPVIAAFWPEARLLATLDELPELLTLAKDATVPMTATCVQLRTFLLPAPNEGMILLDSLGLIAFGQPDVQIITADPPSEAVTTALADLVERFFASGCTLTEGSSFEMADGRSWRASLVRSAFAPDRRVVQLAAEALDDPPPDRVEDSPA